MRSPSPAQPLTRGACDAAGMDWNDNANVCGVAVMAADESRRSR